MIEFRWFQSLKLPPSPLTFVGGVKEESYGALEINPDTVWRYRHTKGLTFQFWSHPERLNEQAWPNVIVDSAYFSISKNFLTFHENIFPMLCCFALWLFFVSKWCCKRKLLGLEISKCIRISTILTMQHERNWSIIIFDTEAARLCIGSVLLCLHVCIKGWKAKEHFLKSLFAMQSSLFQLQSTAWRIDNTCTCFHSPLDVIRRHLCFLLSLWKIRNTKKRS